MFKFWKKDDIVNDDFLNNYQNKHMYFARTQPWDWLNKKEIYVATKTDDKPTMVTMGFWPQEIFLDADGQLSVGDLVDVVRKQFADSKMQVPNKLSEMLITELERLVYEMKIVEFRPEKSVLESNLALPMSKQLKNSN